MSVDKEHIQAIWKSAHAVNDFPGKWTIRRFSPYKKFAVIAWENAVSRVEAQLRQHEGKGDA